MLTTEQYDSILRAKAIPIINACLTTGDNPNAKSYMGHTRSSQNMRFTFDKTMVAKYKEQIIDIYKELPRTLSPAAPYGYVAFTDFFTNSSDRQKQQFELRVANAFINLSTCADIILANPLIKEKNVLLGANVMLRFHIPATNISEKSYKS